MAITRAVLFILLCVTTVAAEAQVSLARRPVPYPVFTTPAFEAAIKKGTRTRTGEPGKAYWMNKASYRIQAALSPETAVLNGEETVRYQNNSPDTLYQLTVYLLQNIHREGVERNRTVEITGGIMFSKVMVDGKPIIEHKLPHRGGYKVDGTLMYIYLEEPLFPGKKIDLGFGWTFKIPKAVGLRMGQDGEAFFLGYWYPQMAAYDDVTGWADEPYMGNGEFYMDYADYEVDITVPQGWLVAATGVLENAEDVLSRQTRKRLAKAKNSTEKVVIVDRADQFPGVATREEIEGETLTWHFEANNVRDFAFGTSDQYIWEAAAATVGPDGKKALVQTFYRWGTPAWVRATEYTRFSLEYLSNKVTPYPWPHMTSVEGIVGGGMEYPMVAIVGGKRSDKTLFGVILHEVAHMWFPMIVGQDEKAFAWMDEGLVTYNTNEGRQVFSKDSTVWKYTYQFYRAVAESGNEVDAMRPADEFPVKGNAARIGSYNKPALALRALQGIVGEERFLKAYRIYTRRWAYRHPQPYDFFNTFNQVLGENIDWFWRSMFYETWTLDQAISNVAADTGRVAVTIEDKGLMPMPVLLKVTYADGTVEQQQLPVDPWLEGKRLQTASFKAGNLVRVEIDPERYLPDIDRRNNVWTPQNLIQRP